MNIKDVNTEDLKNMSEEEQREYVRELIHAQSEEQSGVQAAFLGPNGEHIPLTVLAEKLGEEETINLVVKAMNLEGTECHTVNRKEYDELVAKAERGEELTSSEQAVLNAINNHVSTNTEEFQKHSLEALFEVIWFAQEKVKFFPAITELSMIFHLLVLETIRNTESSKVSMYKGGSCDQLMQMAESVGDDILNTWRESLSEQHDDGMVIIALMSAMIKEMVKYEQKHKASLTIPGINYLRDVSGLTEPFLGLYSDYAEEDEGECSCGSDCHCNGECDCHNEIENGSNQDKDFDKTMRNKLKE